MKRKTRGHGRTVSTDVVMVVMRDLEIRSTWSTVTASFLNECIKSQRLLSGRSSNRREYNKNEARRRCLVRQGTPFIWLTVELTKAHVYGRLCTSPQVLFSLLQRQSASICHLLFYVIWNRVDSCNRRSPFCKRERYDIRRCTFEDEKMTVKKNTHEKRPIANYMS